MIKPVSLVIHAENGVLIGVDQKGTRYRIRWCGNGAYSHWTITPENDPERGWYEFIYNGPEYEREQRSSLLEKQIRAAEHTYRIYA